MLVPEPCHDVPWAVLVRDKLWFRKFFATFADVAKTNFCNIFVAKKCCKKIWHFLNVATWNVANFSGVQKLLQTAMLQTFWANLHCCKSQLLQKKKPMLGAQLILLYYIRISFSTPKTFFLFGWWVVGIGFIFFSVWSFFYQYW